MLHLLQPFAQTLDLTEEAKLQADKDYLAKQQADPLRQRLADHLTAVERGNPSDLTRILTGECRE